MFDIECMENEIGDNLERYEIKRKKLFYSLLIVLLFTLVTIILYRGEVKERFFLRIILVLPLLFTMKIFLSRFKSYFSSWELLVYKTYKGSIKDIMLIIKNNNISYTSENASTLLFIAIYRKNLKLVKSFINNGIDVNIKFQKCSNVTPLHLAYLYYNKDIVSYLTEAGADIDAIDNHNKKPNEYYLD